MAGTPQPIRINDLHGKRRRFSWLTFFASAAILLFVALILGKYVPAMRLLFRDFHMELPAATRVLLELSNLFLSGGWAAVIVVPVGLGFLMPWLSSRQAARTAADYARILDRLIAAMIVGLTILAMIIVTYIAMILPMFSLIEGMTSNASRR